MIKFIECKTIKNISLINESETCIITDCEKLENVIISSSASHNIIRNCPNLISAEIKCPDISLENCKGLKRIEFSGDINIANCPNIADIHIHADNCAIGIDKQLKHLRYLKTAHCKYVSPAMAKIYKYIPCQKNVIITDAEDDYESEDM